MLTNFNITVVYNPNKCRFTAEALGFTTVPCNSVQEAVDELLYLLSARIGAGQNR